MGLQGTFNTIPIIDVMLWMSQKNRTGILTLKRASLCKTMTLQSGHIVNAASNEPREFFGQFLINFGIINEDQLQKAFETQIQTKVLLGKILVMTGLASEDQIRKMLELKIRETFLDVFLWDEGSFEFADSALPEESSVVHISVDLLKLYQEGMARRNHYQQIRKVIPSNQCRFKSPAEALPAPVDPRSPEGVMLHLARQGFSAQDIILRFHSLDFPILKSLYEMIKRGWISVGTSDGAEAEETEIPEPEVSIEGTEVSGALKYIKTADAALAKGEPERALAILQKGIQQLPDDPMLLNALQKAETKLTEALRSELLSENRIPFLKNEDLIKLGKKWNPSQRYLLSRIDGQRSLRSIIMVSPLKEVEALRAFYQLIKAGYVGLR